MISYVGFSQSTIDFETGGVGAAWTWTVDQNGTNPALEFVANPNTTGNTSAMTAKLTTEVAGQAWALAFSDDIGSFTFDANNSLVKMMVRKTVATDVALKFEIPSGINKEVKATSTATNGDWEELSFDFSSVIGSTYSRIVVIPDFLARTSENIIYFDQISFNAATVPPPVTLIDFETGGVGAAWTWTVDQNGTNPALEFVANPNTTGNTSAMTAKLTTEVAGQAWALAFSDDIGSFTFDANNSLVKMMVRKTVATDVALKFEIPSGINKEVKATSTATNGDWEELSFDFTSAIGNTYSRIVVIPDFLARTSENIVYFDQISFNAGTVTPPLTTLSVDFETATAFAADSGSTYTDLVTNDLSATGINPSAKVGQASMVNNGPWANTQMIVTDGLDLSGGDRGFSLMVKGPRAVSVKLKLEGGTPTEQDASYTATNTWQRLTWNFSSDTAVDHNKIVLFFDISGAASAAATDDVFMIDNLEFRAFSALAVNKFTASSVKMYPNPASSGVVKFSTALGDTLIVSVFDLLGKLVQPAQVIQSELNISSLKPGVYFVRMEQGANSITKKLLVN